MATKKFENMTKPELLKAIKSLKLQDKVDELGKDEDSLINADYVKVLNDFKDKQDEINGVTESESKEDSKVVAPGLPKTRQEKIELAAKYNMTKTRVVVTDHDNTQSTDEDILRRGIKISWGNKFTLGQTDTVFMHGEPQYVRNGALSAMETMLIPTNSKDKSTRSKKRFSIVEVEGWSQEKIDELKEQQKLKGN